MAATGKTKRKVKGKTLDLSSFLGDQVAAPGFAVVTPRRDWADCVEEESDDKYPSYWKDDKKIVLPTAPKAARGPDFDVSKIPTYPPFTAYIGNLPYDIVDDEIFRFFANLNVTSVRLPRDGGERGRMRGFGYAEFETRQDLIDALSLNGETLKNRPVKVSLAGENENDRNDRKNDGIDRTASDWRSGSKDDTFSSNNRRNSKDNRYDDSDREPYRGRNSYGDDRNRFDGERRGFNNDRNRFDGDRNNFDDRNRFDGNKPSYQGRRSTERDYGFSSGGERDRGGFGRRYGDGGFDSFDRNRDRGSGFDRRGDKRDDFEFRRGGDRDDRDRGFNRNNRMDRDRRNDMESKYNDSESRDNDQDKDRPKERIKLQLKPRSVPVDQTPASAESSASIFGGAKPVDTAAREREIELRLAREKERVEDVPKPKFINSERTKEEKIIKKSILSENEEELHEKNQDVLSKENEFIETSSRNGIHVRDVHVQENGVTVPLLTNKFAHLSTQVDD